MNNILKFFIKIFLCMFFLIGIVIMLQVYFRPIPLFDSFFLKCIYIPICIMAGMINIYFILIEKRLKIIKK